MLYTAFPVLSLMNIFATDSDPIQSARNLCNRHIVKMCVETCQILSFAFPYSNDVLMKNSNKISHHSHPASIWCRDSLANMEWLLSHGLAMCEEYTSRYKREHASEWRIKWIADHYTELSYLKVGLTPFARCFGEFKSQLDLTVDDTIEAYRQFYILDKMSFAKWPSIDVIPDWWPNKDASFVDKNFKDGIYTKRILKILTA